MEINPNPFSQLLGHSQRAAALHDQVGLLKKAPCVMHTPPKKNHFWKLEKLKTQLCDNGMGELLFR